MSTLKNRPTIKIGAIEIKPTKGASERRSLALRFGYVKPTRSVPSVDFNQLAPILIVGRMTGVAFGYSLPGMRDRKLYKKLFYSRFRFQNSPATVNTVIRF